MKAQLANPTRPPGPATAECEANAPVTSCPDADALAPTTPALLHYQVLGACGSTGNDEGPF